MILLGHNNILSRKTLEEINSNKIKVSLWYEDHVAFQGPNWKNNLSLIEKILRLLLLILHLIAHQLNSHLTCILFEMLAHKDVYF